MNAKFAGVEKKLEAVRLDASLAVIVNVNVPVAPIAMPEFGLPPPRKLPPSAAPARYVPNGAALSLNRFENGCDAPAFNDADAPASRLLMLNTNPVSLPPFPTGLVFVSEITSVPVLPDT